MAAPSASPAETSSPASPAPSARAWRVAAIAGVLLAFAVATWLRFYRLGDAVGGFHAYDEGYYLHFSLEYFRNGAFSSAALAPVVGDRSQGTVIAVGSHV